MRVWTGAERMWSVSGKTQVPEVASWDRRVAGDRGGRETYFCVRIVPFVLIALYRVYFCKLFYLEKF